VIENRDGQNIVGMSMLRLCGRGMCSESDTVRSWVPKLDNDCCVIVEMAQ
jgi:hypothetical protein